jgi:hypothetical protein
MTTTKNIRKHCHVVFTACGKTRRAKVLAVRPEAVLVTWGHRQHQGWVWPSQIESVTS